MSNVACLRTESAWFQSAVLNWPRISPDAGQTPFMLYLRVMFRGAVRCRHCYTSVLFRRNSRRLPCGGRSDPIIEAQPRRLNLPDVAARPWRRTIYRSVLRRPRWVPMMTCYTAGRESRNSRAMAAGVKPASRGAAHCDGGRFLLPRQHHQPLDPRDPGIDHAPPQYRVVLLSTGFASAGDLASPALVHRRSTGQHQRDVHGVLARRVAALPVQPGLSGTRSLSRRLRASLEDAQCLCGRVRGFPGRNIRDGRPSRQTCARSTRSHVRFRRALRRPWPCA